MGRRPTTDRWYAEDGPYVQKLNEALRVRPGGHPDPTSDDVYYDGEPDPQSHDMLWHDNSEDREGEL